MDIYEIGQSKRQTDNSKGQLSAMMTHSKTSRNYTALYHTRRQHFESKKQTWSPSDDDRFTSMHQTMAHVL
jgi:hypothetical protein